MMTKGRVETLKSLLSNYLNRPVRIRFAEHSFSAVIMDVVLAKVTELRNAPEKRMNVEGKYVTPAVVTFICDVGKLHFVLDDMQSPVITTQGISITIGPTEVTITHD